MQPRMHAPERRELSPEELEAQEATELPERRALSLVNANLAAPINCALALNVASDNSAAVAVATQYAPMQQSI